MSHSENDNMHNLFTSTVFETRTWQHQTRSSLPVNCTSSIQNII